MANNLSNLIGVVVFAVIGIILDVAVLIPILDDVLYTTTTDDTGTTVNVLAVDGTVGTLIEIVPLFIALAILLAVAGAMVSYYKHD